MKKSIVVVGLGFGDEGKGSIVDALTQKKETKTIVRFNGGPQAAHHVVRDNGEWHCFSQFSSGMFSKDTKTWLSEFMLVDPLALIREEQFLQKHNICDAFERLYIDAHCVVVTPFHKYLNRLHERTLSKNR